MNRDYRELNYFQFISKAELPLSLLRRSSAGCCCMRYRKGRFSTSTSSICTYYYKDSQLSRGMFPVPLQLNYSKSHRYSQNQGSKHLPNLYNFYNRQKWRRFNKDFLARNYFFTFEGNQLDQRYFLVIFLRFLNLLASLPEPLNYKQ